MNDYPPPLLGQHNAIPRRIWDLLADGLPRRNAAVAKALGLPDSTTHGALRRMADAGVVMRLDHSMTYNRVDKPVPPSSPPTAVKIGKHGRPASFRSRVASKVIEMGETSPSLVAKELGASMNTVAAALRDLTRDRKVERVRAGGKGLPALYRPLGTGSKEQVSTANKEQVSTAKKMPSSELYDLLEGVEAQMVKEGLLSVSFYGISVTLSITHLEAPNDKSACGLEGPSPDSVTSDTKLVSCRACRASPMFSLATWVLGNLR